MGLEIIVSSEVSQTHRCLLDRKGQEGIEIEVRKRGWC